MKLITLLLILSLGGCASFGEVAESPTTFAVCKAADVATTAIALNSGRFHEANPLLKPFIGPHNFVPLIAFSVGVYLIIRHINDSRLTVAANAITCGVAVHNMFVL